MRKIFIYDDGNSFIDLTKELLINEDYTIFEKEDLNGYDFISYALTQIGDEDSLIVVKAGCYGNLEIIKSLVNILEKNDDKLSILSLNSDGVYPDDTLEENLEPHGLLILGRNFVECNGIFINNKCVNVIKKFVNTETIIDEYIDILIQGKYLYFYMVNPEKILYCEDLLEIETVTEDGEKDEFADINVNVMYIFLVFIFLFYTYNKYLWTLTQMILS